MKVESVIAHTPCYGALFSNISYLICLAFDACRKQQNLRLRVPYKGP